MNGYLLNETKKRCCDATEHDMAGDGSPGTEPVPSVQRDRRPRRRSGFLRHILLGTVPPWTGSSPRPSAGRGGHQGGLMRAIFIQIKCEMGQAYKVAHEAADTI